uniref:RRM domain-containing protein n=1 Tax=Emiliania huxleyi TaxID=2903 RepID=A0A7S3S663_EMIHU
MTAGSTWTFVNGVKVTQVPGEAPASRSAPPVLLPAKHTPIMATGISAPKLELSGQHAAGHSGLPPPPPGTVFLSSIPEALDDAQLLQLICTFGDATSLQRAVTFATFTYSEGDEMGQTAIYALNGLELGGASLAARKATAQDLAALRGSAELRDEAPKPPANGGGAEGAPKPWVVELRGVVGDDTDADIAEQDVHNECSDLGDVSAVSPPPRCGRRHSDAFEQARVPFGRMRLHRRHTSLRRSSAGVASLLCARLACSRSRCGTPTAPFSSSWRTRRTPTGCARHLAGESTSAAPCRPSCCRRMRSRALSRAVDVG